HGWQICTHAIGDRGCRETLDAYEAAMKAVPARDPRLRVEHAQNPAVSDIPRFAKLGVIASMQQTHATSDMRWAEDRVGLERAKGAYAWRKFLAAGARIAGGSDFPVEGENPLWGFHAAITRQDHDGKPEGGWRPEERMTREEALRSFTLDAAYASFEEADRGSLEPGKLADFVVFSKDIMSVPPREILSTDCLLTVIGGEVVFRR
ncbi:MAG: amidohydrolase, partial [Vicinamibacteria bacterium]